MHRLQQTAVEFCHHPKQILTEKHFLVPNFYNVDDFQIFTPTDIIGQHIHLVKFDVTSSDGSGNGWNYEDGTHSPGAIRERIHAINEANLERVCNNEAAIVPPGPGVRDRPGADSRRRVSQGTSGGPGPVDVGAVGDEELRVFPIRAAPSA